MATISRRRFLAAVLLPAMAPDGALSQRRQPHWPEYMTIGTGSAGGTYHAYGQALAGLLTRELGLEVRTRPTEGPAENITLLEAGEMGRLLRRDHVQGGRGDRVVRSSGQSESPVGVSRPQRRLDGSVADV